MVRLLEPTYFPPISHWKFIKSKDLLWSINSRYNKQTLTNRTYIDSANGELMLTVPIKHSGKNQPRVYSDIKLDLSSDWKKNHFKSIKICYQSSPFYEFYEDDIISFFNLDFEKCVNNKNLEDHILEERIDGAKKYNIQSTPTLIINDKKFDKKLNYKNLKKTLEKMI